MMYEEVSLQQKALSVIPVVRLKDQASANLTAYLSQPPTDGQEAAHRFDMDDFVLIELLAWFKNEFFTWTDQPNCTNCNSNEQMFFLKKDMPNRDELIWMASSVEVYQ